MPGRQRDDEVAMQEGDDVGRYDQRTARLLREFLDSALDLSRVVHGGEGQLHAERRCSRLDPLHVLNLCGITWIENDSHSSSAGCGVLEQFEPLATDRIFEGGKPSN